MQKKTYQFKGLDIRNNPLTRNPDSASDMCNVHLDSKRQLKKRYGFTEFLTTAVVKKLISFIGNNKLLAQTTTGLVDITSGTLVAVPLGGVAPVWNGKVNHAEYNKTMYFTDEDDNTDLYKYDNYALYRAGMPQPVVTGQSGATYWWRVFFEFRDGQGLVVFSDYAQFQSDNTATLSIAYPTTEGFHYKYGKVNGTQTINSGNLTLNTNAALGHNYIANDYVRIFTPSPFTVKMVKIESVTANTITFNSASVGADSFFFSDLAPIEYRVALRVYRSGNKTYGYQAVNLSGFWGMSGHGILNNQTSPMSVAISSGVIDFDMEEEYDTTRLKGLPPRCRYISFFNNIIILKRKVPDEKAFSFEQQIEESSFYWSDLSVGSCVETFNPFDYELVGKAEEGEITGGNGDIIFKEKTPYQIVGNLSLKTYALRPLNSNGVGCVSHQSVLSLDNGCLFMSARGVYWVGRNQLPKELTDRIEPLFTKDTTGLQLESAISFNDSKNEKVWVYVPSSVSGNEVVFVMDYYFKEWFIYKGIPALNGICIFNDEIYYATATKVHKQNTAYNDDGAPIDAWYATNWQNCGGPSLKKKFIRFLVLALEGTTWLCNIVSQKNWKAVDDTNVSVQLDSDNMVVDKSLNVNQAYSMRFIMRNNVLNEGLDVTGYEYEYEHTQQRPKGEL